MPSSTAATNDYLHCPLLCKSFFSINHLIYKIKRTRKLHQQQRGKPLFRSQTEILGWTAPVWQVDEWPDEGAHTPHRGCCCLDSQLYSSYTATLKDRTQTTHSNRCTASCNNTTSVSVALFSTGFNLLSLTCVGRRRNWRKAFLNSGCSRGESRPLAGRAEDGSHLVHCCAMSTVPWWQRWTGRRQKNNKIIVVFYLSIPSLLKCIFLSF